MIEITGSFSVKGRATEAKRDVKNMLEVWQSRNFKQLFTLTALNFRAAEKYEVTKNKELYNNSVKDKTPLKELYRNKKYWLHKRTFGIISRPRYTYEDIEILGNLKTFEIKKIHFKSDAFITVVMNLKFKNGKRNGTYLINFLSEKKAYVLNENGIFLFYPISFRNTK